MAELPTGDAEETESADAATTKPKLRYLAAFVFMLVIIAAIAIPNLLHYYRIQANEEAAIKHLDAIRGAQTGWSCGGFPYASSFAELTDTANGLAFLLGEWHEGVQKDGYIFTMKGTLIPSTLAVDGWASCYETTASPAIPGITGKRYFFSDCSAVIRANKGAPADSTSPMVPGNGYDSYGNGVSHK